MDHDGEVGNAAVRCDLHAHDAGHTAILTLNRPEERNPLDLATIVELNHHLDRLIADPECRAVIVTGAGPAFSAGGDLKKYVDLYQDFKGFEAFLAAIRDAFDRLESSRLVSIAAVNGVCVAGGFELALSCDLITMSSTARIGDAHLGFWQLPGGGGSQRLPRAVGTTMARRLFLTTELLNAGAALASGLVTRVSEPDELLAESLALAKQVTQAPAETILGVKALMGFANNQPLTDGLSSEQAFVASYTHGPQSTASQGLHVFAARKSTPRRTAS